MTVGEWWWQNARPIGETLKAWAETIAYASGGVFLIYKVLAGYFITDVSLTISSVRAPREQGHDYLSVTASLKKGDKGTIRIHDARVRITQQMSDNVVDEQRMIGIDRLSYTTDQTGRLRIDFSKASKTAPWLSLPPGDETQFVALCDVPNTLPCSIEVVILGCRLWGGRTGQWRASAISFPNR